MVCSSESNISKILIISSQLRLNATRHTVKMAKDKKDQTKLHRQQIFGPSVVYSAKRRFGLLMDTVE